MAEKKPNWGRIKHAYVTGSMGYKEIAKKYDIPWRTLTYEAKKCKWVEARKRYREEVAHGALARAREREVDKLESIRATSDRLADQLESILRDEKQIRMHTGIVRHEDGSEEIAERELQAINTKSVRDIVASMKDLTLVLRNLHSIRTDQEQSAERMAEERLQIEKARMEMEKERLELEKAKAKLEEKTDNVIRIEYADEEMEV